MMELCDNGHDEICHTEKNCPMCEADDIIASLEIDVEDKDTEIEEKYDIIAKLEEKIEELKNDT